MKNDNKETEMNQENLARKVAKRTIGPASVQVKDESQTAVLPAKGLPFAFYRRPVIVIAAVLIILAALGIGLTQFAGVLNLPELLELMGVTQVDKHDFWPEMQLNETAKLTLGSVLIFVTVIIGLLACLVSIIRLAGELWQDRQMRSWLQVKAQVSTKGIILNFNSEGECRPQIEYEYFVEGNSYRSSHLPVLIRNIQEPEEKEARLNFSAIKLAYYNPEDVQKACLAVPEKYLNSRRHEMLCLLFSIVLAFFLAVALWHVADEIIPAFLHLFN